MFRISEAAAEGLPVSVPAPLVDLPRIRERCGVIFLAVRADSRPAVATTIEGLINFLDTIDADPDLEENGDERDAGAPWGSLPHCVNLSEDSEECDHGGGDIQDEPHDEEPDREIDDHDGEGNFEGSGCDDSDPFPNFKQALEALSDLAPEPRNDMTVDEWIAKYEALPPDAQSIIRFGLSLFDKARLEESK